MTRRQLIIVSYLVLSHDRVVRSEPATVLFEIFKAQVRHDYEIKGTVAVYRATRDRATGRLVRGPEINQREFALTENEDILIINDEEKFVVPGGLGGGASIVSHTDPNALAKAGFGTGGKIDEARNVKGGDGVGGSARGIDIFGTAGAGYGGDVRPHPDGGSAEGGTGVGGEMVVEISSTRARQSGHGKQGKSSRNRSSSRKGGRPAGS